jgi:hypothetical protein
MSFRKIGESSDRVIEAGKAYDSSWIFPSRFLVYWLQDFMSFGVRHPVNIENIGQPPHALRSEVSRARFTKGTELVASLREKKRKRGMSRTEDKKSLQSPLANEDPTSFRRIPELKIDESEASSWNLDPTFQLRSLDLSFWEILFDFFRTQYCMLKLLFGGLLMVMFSLL